MNPERFIAQVRLGYKMSEDDQIAFLNGLRQIFRQHAENTRLDEFFTYGLLGWITAQMEQGLDLNLYAAARDEIDASRSDVTELNADLSRMIAKNRDLEKEIEELSEENLKLERKAELHKDSTGVWLEESIENHERASVLESRLADAEFLLGELNTLASEAWSRGESIEPEAVRDLVLGYRAKE